MRYRSFLEYSCATLVFAGFVLLIGPKHWFPDFYNPTYMGIVAIISPFLIYLPNFILKKGSVQKRNLILKMRSVIAFSLIINVAGELGLFKLYQLGFEYDKFAHFIVNMLFAFILGESLKEWEHFSLRKRMFLAFWITFGAGILWELFEATSDFLFKTQEWGVYGQHLALDTYKDIAFNTLGALAGIIVFMIPKGRHKKSAPKK